MPWRGPQHADDFPSLGWDLLDWWAEFLPSPRDPSSSLMFTDEQAMQLVEWFRLDPKDGRLVYRRGYSRRSKGWGKSPVEAAKAIAEFAGPVRFGGWDADGEPVGVPWGRKDAPRAWVQIGAISEDQTDNTWSVVHYFLTENDGKAADALRIDAGLTRCFLRDQPGAKLEPVTSAAGSREGQPITYGVIDESHLMLPSNGGVKLARTIRRNVAKMGGRSYETTNSPELGLGSVAESSMNAVQAGGAGIFADEVEAPRVIDGVPVDLAASDEILIRALGVAYGDSWWVDKERLVADSRDKSTPWEDSARFFFNWPQTGVSARIVPAEVWAAAGDDLPVPACGRQALVWDVSPDSSWSSVGWVGERADGVLHGEVVESAAGTAWVAERLARYASGAGDLVVAVGYVGSTPAEALVPDVVAAFKAAGLTLADGKDGNLVKVSGMSFAAGCVEWFNKTSAGTLRHLRQAWLTSAVDGAVWRNTGETRVWDRKNATSEITPLCCVTVGLRVLEAAPVKKPVDLRIW